MEIQDPTNGYEVHIHLQLMPIDKYGTLRRVSVIVNTNRITSPTFYDTASKYIINPAAEFTGEESKNIQKAAHEHIKKVAHALMYKGLYCLSPE